jgi:copper chaperone CopZ
MKNICTALALTFVFAASGQSKYTETTIEVDGLCGMCEERIENAAYLPGVRSVDWDQETHQLALVFQNSKVSLDEIIASINNVGHDVKGHLASDEQYAKIHGCCRFRDPDLRANHGLGEALCTPDSEKK